MGGGLPLRLPAIAFRGYLLRAGKEIPVSCHALLHHRIVVFLSNGQQKCTGNCVYPRSVSLLYYSIRWWCYSGCTAQLNRPGFVPRRFKEDDVRVKRSRFSSVILSAAKDLSSDRDPSLRSG